MFRKNKGRYLIKTPTGYKNFEGVQKKIVDSLYTINFEDGTEIKCSGNHAFLSDNGFLKANELTEKNTLTGKKIRNILSEFGSYEVYDPVGVEEHSTYFSNGVVSHNTEFIGSSSTLVSGVKLRSLAFHNPISTEEGLDVYETAQKGRLYICTVDCSEGVGLDFHSINVIDVTELPYRQVAKYRNNKLPLLFLPTIIYSLATKYNEAFVLIETNNVGQQVVDVLHYDLEYENVFKIDHHHIKGQTISGGFKRAANFGIRTTKTVKKIGCANLKTLIETDKLIINDFDTIAELNTFVRVRDSYAAEEGNNDDLVMGLVLFAWLTAQSYFKDSTNIDIRRVLIEENGLDAEENLVPVGFIDDGKQEEIIMDGKDVWTEKGYPTSLLH
jgi:hypothetical protein